MMCVLRVNGYAAECERTVFLREPTAREKELFEHMKNARDIAFAMLKPGVSCSDIDAATRDYFASQGLAQYILHRTGHGFGLSGHEAPWLSRGSKDILKENMFVSIEPALYLPEIGGFRHSDTVRITENGYECLTTYPTSLGELTLPTSKPLKSIQGSIVRHALGLA
jgi:Xaa-Pro dipeptidase